MSFFPGMSAAIAARVPLPITFSGSFSATAGTSTVTSSTRTATVPAGNSGQITFASMTSTAGDQQYSKNGGGFVSFSQGDMITLADGDTLAIRATGCGSSGVGITSLTIADFDNSGAIESGIAIKRS